MSTSRVYTVGQVLTAAQVNDFPQGVLAKATGSSDIGPTSGTTELDVITAAAVTIAGTGRRLRVRFHTRGVSGTVLSDTFLLRIKEGATILAEAHFFNQTSTPQALGDLEAIIDSPTVGAHTYKVTIQRAIGTGTGVVSGITSPMTLTVEDVGQV